MRGNRHLPAGIAQQIADLDGFREIGIAFHPLFQTPDGLGVPAFVVQQFAQGEQGVAPFLAGRTHKVAVEVLQQHILGLPPIVFLLIRPHRQQAGLACRRVARMQRDALLERFEGLIQFVERQERLAQISQRLRMPPMHLVFHVNLQHPGGVAEILPLHVSHCAVPDLIAVLFVGRERSR